MSQVLCVRFADINGQAIHASMGLPPALSVTPLLKLENWKSWFVFASLLMNISFVVELFHLYILILSFLDFEMICWNKKPLMSISY